MIHFQSPAGAVAPDRSIVAVILESGELFAPGAVHVRPDDPIPHEPGDYIVEHPLAKADAVTRSLAISRMVSLRRNGSTFVLITHDEPLMERCADEVWWIREGKLLTRGDPAQVLPLYRHHVSKQVRDAGEGATQQLMPTMRAGDGRAELASIEVIGGRGAVSTVIASGEQMTIRVGVAFRGDVDDPVVGILIRTRVGLNVYGTNTELEGIRLGPVDAGDALTIDYVFRCELCPGDYTVTAASHDPDGVWHDWQDEAVAFAVTDGRYTAGVANLRARVTFKRSEVRV
jgi:hypothetical protein